MAKPKRLKPKGKLVVRNKKPNAKGEVTISIIFSVNGDVVPRSTGITVKPEQWNAAKQEVVNHKDTRRLNYQLDTIKRNYEAIIDKYDGPLTKERLSKLLDGTLNDAGRDPKKIDFIQYAIDYTKTRYDTNAIGYSTFYNQKLYLEKFRRYLVDIGHEAFLPISEVTSELVDKYKAHRMRGIGNETMNKELTPIYKAIEYAVQNGLMSSRMLSITSGYVTKARSYTGEVDDKETSIHYLTKEQMAAFVSLYPKVKYEKTREKMEMFLFAFHACGLRVSDIVTLEWSHIDFATSTMRKTLVKAKNFHEIRLNDTAIQILRKWQNRGRNPRFVFDLLPADFKFSDKNKNNQEQCDKELKKRITSKNKTIGQSLRDVGMKIGIEGYNLSMHVARHTFAIYALNPPINMSLHLVSRMLGHSSITATEKNYAKYLPETISKEIEDKLQFADYNPLL